MRPYLPIPAFVLVFAIFTSCCFINVNANPRDETSDSKKRELRGLQRDRMSNAIGFGGEAGRQGVKGGAKREPLYQTEEQETSPPTKAPTKSPTEAPTTSPTGAPTTSPTKAPTKSPTKVPTTSPTEAPAPDYSTSSYTSQNPVPQNPGRGYFNYDVNDKDYGPSRWHRVDTSLHPLREFGPNGFGPWDGFFDDDPTDNKCGRQDRRQSPADMKRTVGCDAHHEIRTWCSTGGLSGNWFQKQILPHKLSLVMNRRPCIDMEKRSCQKPAPPNADYPRYSSTITSYADLVNYDIKIPGEHTIDGEKFDAEIQMLHIHPTAYRTSSIGVLVKARDGGYNSEFQEIINEFQNVYDAHARECSRRRKHRSLGFWQILLGAHLEDPEMLDFYQSSNGRFDPYSEALMPTIFFYRYDGSITEPPCKAITWWVMTEPMIISHEQLNQIKNILFTHVDGNCEPTSVHNADQSVARPSFSRDGREIQECAAGSYKSDEEKGVGIGRKCW